MDRICSRIRTAESPSQGTSAFMSDLSQVNSDLDFTQPQPVMSAYIEPVENPADSDFFKIINPLKSF